MRAQQSNSTRGASILRCERSADERRALRVLREARPGSGERVLVVIVNRVSDLEIARTQGWYRIPIARAPRRVGADFLAFYLTGAFPPAERHRIGLYAPIYAYRLATRLELLPHEPDHPRAGDRYFKIEIGPLQRLERAVISERLRRVTFIATTWTRLRQASEIGELWERGGHRVTHPAPDGGSWAALDDEEPDVE